MSVRGLRGGRLVTPDGIVETGAVWYENGTVLGTGLVSQAPRGIGWQDWEGWILPGFVAMHVHGGGGADFMDGAAEDFRTAGAAHLAFGATSIAPTAMSADRESMLHFLDTYKLAKGTAEADFLGLHLEGPYFAGSQKGAQPGDRLAVPTEEETELFLTHANGNLRRWDGAPELPGMEGFAKRLKAQGVLVSAAHTDATAEELHAAADWGFSMVTHLYCGTSFRRKRDGFVRDGVNEEALIHPAYSVEVIADGCHVTRASMLLAWKMKGSDRMALVTDAMRAAGTDVTESILGGKIGGTPVVIEDGVAKLTDRSCFAGSICTCDRALCTAVGYGIPIEEASKMLSATPARLLGAAKKGSLQAGKDADIVLMDETLAVREVFVRGERRIRK